MSDRKCKRCYQIDLEGLPFVSSSASSLQISDAIYRTLHIEASYLYFLHAEPTARSSVSSFVN